MASNSYPRPGYAGGAVQDMLYERLVSHQAPDGLINGVGSAPALFVNGSPNRLVFIRAGLAALVRGFMWEAGDTDIPIELDPNTSGLLRKDLIVVRLNRTGDWRITEIVHKGVPGGGVPGWATSDSETTNFEFPLGYVDVPHNANILAASAPVQRAWYVTEDGNIACSSTTWPPSEMARIIHEYDKDKWWGSTGAGEPYRLLYEDTGWVPLTVQSGWKVSSWSKARVRRLNGMVSMQCDLIRNGTGVGAHVASNLAGIPAGYRPAIERTISGQHISALATARITVNPSGMIRLTNSGGFGPTDAIAICDTWPVG